MSGASPAVADRGVLLRVEGLTKHFPIQRGVFRRTVGHVRAVEGVSFELREGETLGLVGESGCGKTTAGRCLPRLIEPTSGRVLLREGDREIDVVAADRRALAQVRREMQIVFQDPVSSLDPRMTIRDLVAEPLRVNSIGTHKQRTEMVAEALALVHIRAEYMGRYPHEFSGGQRQRVGICRSLILRPRLLICDEAVSALDVSIQAQVINLLADLQEELKLTYIFIAHNLGVVEHISNRVAVMYLGRIVELGPTESLYQSPRHPYTEALLSSIPLADPLARQTKSALEGDVPDPSNPPPGCYFHPRCPYAKEVCRVERPELTPLAGDPARSVACHRAGELTLKGYEEIRQSRRQPPPA